MEKETQETLENILYELQKANEIAKLQAELDLKASLKRQDISDAEYEHKSIQLDLF